MSLATQSREYDAYFQTSDTIESQARRAAKAGNAHGRPVRLPAKLSAVALDPTSRRTAGAAAAAERVYVAASDGFVRRVRLPPVDGGAGGPSVGSGGSGSKDYPQQQQQQQQQQEDAAVDLVLKGPKAPLTSLQVVQVGPEKVMVFAGCWDKCAYAWEVDGGKQSGETKIFGGGHSDFVKCVAVYQHLGQGGSQEGEALSGTVLLVSGSADRSLVIWDVKSGERLVQLKNFHKTSLNALVVDPAGSKGSEAPTFTVISGSSDGEILETEFEIKMSSETTGKVTVEPSGRKNQLSAHPTTVYGLAFYGDDFYLATASADGSATIMKRNEQAFGPWEVETRLKHEGHVRCVAAEINEGLGPEGARVFTGGRDESVKLWNATTGKLVCKFEGHYDEVTGLVADDQSRHRRAISVSLDGTVRTWDAAEMERIQRGGDSDEEVKDKAQPSLMTAEEEAELAELMDDDD